MLVIMLTASVALLLACIAFGIYEMVSFRLDMLQDHSTIAKIIANNTEAALNFSDRKAAEDILNSFKADPDISGICIYSKNGRIFAQYDRPDDDERFSPPRLAPAEGYSTRNGHLAVAQRIFSDGEVIGAVYEESNLRELYSRLKRYGVIVSGIYCLTLIISFLVSAKLQRVITEPILHLAQAARKVAQDKNYSIRVPDQRPDEIGTLIKGFNEMLQQIQERDANLERRVKERTEELASSISLLNATLESTADGIIAQDLEGGIISFNSKFLSLFGFPADMLKRRDPAEMRKFVGAQMKNEDGFFESYRASCASPNTTFCEVEMNDGRVLERYSFPQYIDGVHVGVVVNWRDVTERKNSEKALRESQGLYSSLVEQLPVNVYRKDAEGRYVFVNSNYCRLKGLRAAEIIGRMPADIASPEKAAQYTREHALIMDTGKSIELEESYPQPGGAVRHFHIVKLPVFSSDGSIAGSQGIHFDITERKKAEAELEKVHRELMDASRRAGMAEVATGVLHNVGNVLNSVNVSSNVIGDQLKKSRMPYLGLAVALLKEHSGDLGDFLTNDPKGKRLPGYFIELFEKLASEHKMMLKEIGALRNNVEHIKDIVATQQSYAKLGGLTQRVKVLDLVEDALRMNESALLRHDVRVVRQFAEPLPEIVVDRHKVLQILVNLITNAKFACNANDLKDRRLVLSIEHDADRVLIRISDNGAGIPQENLTRIFNHGFTTRKHGHGFGLHSGALAAKEMGGALTVQSDGPGKGATFTLELLRKL